MAAGSTAPEAAVAISGPKPETRRLRLKHHWTRESLDAVYRIGDVYQPEAMAAIDRFMRDWRCDKTVAIDPKLIDRLYEIQQAIGEHRTIRVISAYRSEGYNASLLAAGRTVDPDSEHMLGRAVDIFVPGLNAERLRDVAESHGQGGVGYYAFSGPRFVHVDTGPDRRWAEVDPGVRRRLGLPGMRRQKLQLDCSLTMAQVMQRIAPMEALAALPPGAAADPAASLEKMALASRAFPGALSAAAHPPLDETGAGKADEPFRGRCDDEGGLAPLDVAAKLAEWKPGNDGDAGVRQPGGEKATGGP
ncbi:MAG: DUF882 domain-containing protein [Rhodomicrobium sp.]|nr:DUF882 domain-containing protein [Rhodomicrobium sp.]